MLSFEFPWVFILLPVPLVVYWLTPRANQQQLAVRVPFYRQVSELEDTSHAPLKRKKMHIASLLLLWLCLLCAGASPIWWGDSITLPTSGRDILLAVDISGSMEIEDMQLHNRQVQRIDIVKAVLEDFIERRKGDRLGLVLFGTQAYVQAPLTFDRKTVAKFLRDAQIGFAGDKQTAIGDAIGLSVKRLRERPGERHVMVLLTDGANTGGEVRPIPVARLAAEHNITIYTVGVGADEMIIRGLFRDRSVNPSRDLDEDTLKDIADITHGQYFRARNTEQLNQIYQLLDELEPIDTDAKTYRPQKSLFYWPLATAFLISALLAVRSLLGQRISPTSSHSFKQQEKQREWA